MLTNERIDEIAGPADYFDRRVFARAVEAEVRAKDTALIQQLRIAAITIYPHLDGLAVSSDEALALLRQQIAAITAASARLKETP